MDTSALLGDRYQLSGIIGTGGMSDVYAGTDTLLGRDVAIKVMRADLARDNTFLERFRREASNAAKLNHHAIVAVYDTGQTAPEDGSVPYIVMERVRGRTLRDIIREDGPMAPEHAASVMASVADALEFSHEAGIIHRDIKPANIMITSTGSVKVMDFGIARALGDATSSMTQTAAVIGTAQYLSPEQARGRSADARSDIYAAGCVLYELITGRPPFQGESPFSVAFQHVQDDPVHPSQVPGVNIAPSMSTSVDAVVLTAMAKNPNDRYESAKDFAHDLRLLAQRKIPLAAQAHVDDTTPTTVIPTVVQPQQPIHQPVRPIQPVQPVQPIAPRASTVTQPTSQKEEEKSSLGKWAIAIWVAVALALVGVGGYVAHVYFSTNSASNRITIPDVTGESQTDATNQLESLGLKVATVEKSSADVATGKIIEASPSVGSTVQRGSTVTLTVSTGKEVTEVPDLTGKDTAAARRLLETAGLTLDTTVKEASSDSVEEGKIVEQSPSSGSRVSKGSKVTITVSTGVEKVRVPVVTGQNEADARGNLEGAGFKVTVIEVDSTKPLGTVVSVTDEGQQVPKGEELELQVSKGNLIVMPDLTGKSYSQATSILQAAGWTGAGALSKHDVKTTDLTKVGSVVTQSVPAGTNFDKNSSIDLGVGTFSLS